ncbi:T9SS type A sorting domain-containing protein [Brumimicrobium aurantiacum]|uniref:T9SS C-terminal target domain-containing protein n=1 Tax=Brumimicrobium aurantiacum TaxID=1737063 RepID=A0A3E1F2I7_9FLAO|nr:T9SS type A sorting domain-containing protein [Brumimicrobium aurantiacum]RFC55927.1 T9SS C-terminal target domain-containing protein [Brumimicrobium aurantiacum]
MKKTLLYTALLLMGSQFTSAQTDDTVSIGAGYTNETWYSLENGVQGTATAADWDLSFDLTGFGTSIRVNNGFGTTLYAYPNGDINDWASVDTAGLSTWNPVYNSESSWFVGALDQNVNTNDPWDVGWGVYDQNTHVISGDSIFIIKLMDQSYRKLRIDDMTSGTYNFTFANLDGTNEVQGAVTKSDYTDKLFGYYSIQNETALDYEPVTLDQWDLYFGKYTGFVPTAYNVTGILAGPTTQVVQVDGVTDVAAFNDWGSQTFTDDISTIGSDWKEFEFASMSYVIADDVVYFAKTAAGTIWKIVPTEFGGSADGNFIFTKEKMSTVSLDENGIQKAEVLVYPNPATNNVSIILNNLSAQNAKVQIVGTDGKLMFSKEYVGASNFEVKNISVDSFETGVYIVNIVSGNESMTQKLVIK